MSDDIREEVLFYMTQTARLLKAKQEGAQYLGDPPIIDGRQAIIAGAALLGRADLKANPRFHDNVSRRHGRIVEEFDQLQAEETNVA